MTELDFQLAKQGYNRIPVVSEIRADLDTPVALYLKLANKPYTYLLESVVGGERFGRYSYIGLPSSERIEARGTNVSVHRRGPDGEESVERFRTPTRSYSCATISQGSGPRLCPACPGLRADWSATSAMRRCNS